MAINNPYNPYEAYEELANPEVYRIWVSGAQNTVDGQSSSDGEENPDDEDQSIVPLTGDGVRPGPWISME